MSNRHLFLLFLFAAIVICFVPFAWCAFDIIRDHFRLRRIVKEPHREEHDHDRHRPQV
jgi:hypothetical protein